MAYIPSFSFNFVRSASNIFKRISVCKYCTMNEEVNVATKTDDDAFLEIQNPYEKENPKCILCKYGIEPNYKNVRLLSQFVSKYTGKIIPRHVSGICEKKHKQIVFEISKARAALLMPVTYKFPEFFEDPELFNIHNLSKPRRVI